MLLFFYVINAHCGSFSIQIVRWLKVLVIVLWNEMIQHKNPVYFCMDRRQRRDTRILLWMWLLNMQKGMLKRLAVQYLHCIHTILVPDCTPKNKTWEKLQTMFVILFALFAFCIKTKDDHHFNSAVLEIYIWKSWNSKRSICILIYLELNETKVNFLTCENNDMHTKCSW